MKHTLTACLLVLGFAGASSSYSQKPIPKANCELRLVSNAGAGEACLSIFTQSEEECLSKSDRTVEAKFRAPRGSAISKRGGAGPQP